MWRNLILGAKWLKWRRVGQSKAQQCCQHLTFLCFFLSLFEWIWLQFVLDQDSRYPFIVSPAKKFPFCIYFFFRWAKATVTNVRERRPVISGPFQFSVLFFRCLNKLLLHLNWARSGCEDDRWCWMRARILHYANEVANDSGNRPQFIGIQQLRLASGSQLINQEGSTEWLPIELN